MRSRGITAVFALENAVAGIFRQQPSQSADSMTELERAGSVFAVPEGHPRRHSRRRIHNDPVMLDCRNPPCRRAELEHVANSRLVNELFVELSEPRPVGEIHCVETTVGNRSARYYGSHSRRTASSQPARDLVPRNSRLEFSS